MLFKHQLALKEKSSPLDQVPLEQLWVTGVRIPDSNTCSSSRRVGGPGQLGNLLRQLRNHLSHHWQFLQPGSQQLIMLSEQCSLAVECTMRVCWVLMVRPFCQVLQVSSDPKATSDYSAGST